MRRAFAGFVFGVTAVTACRTHDPLPPTRAAIPRFVDYAVSETYQGPAALPDLRSDPEAPRFRTVLVQGSRRGPNFAGHYTVVTWGCGSPCHSFAIVDARTGRVYMVPFSTMEGAEFHLTSALFVAEPPAAVREACTYAWMKVLCEGVTPHSYYYRWDGERLVLIDSVAVDSLPAPQPKQ